MERNFSIDRTYLKFLLDKLAEFGEYEDFIKDFFRLDRVINRYENNFFEDNDDNLRESIEDDLDRYHFYKPYYPFAVAFANRGHSLEELNQEHTYTKLEISDEESFDTVSSFFKAQSEFFSSGFEDYEEEANEHLEFVDKDADTDGEMLYLHTTGDAFVFCPNYSNFTKITILAHEIEHVIDSFKNENLFENSLVREIAPVFMEMIAADYVARKYGLNRDNYYRRLLLHSIIKEQALIIIDKMEMLELIDDNRHLSEEKIYNILLDNGFTLELISILMEKSIDQDFYYLLAQLIAIELYFIYLKNRKRALDILEDIILNATNDNILEILSKHNIKLNKNVNKYEKRLLKGINKKQ